MIGEADHDGAVDEVEGIAALLRMASLVDPKVFLLLQNLLELLITGGERGTCLEHRRNQLAVADGQAHHVSRHFLIDSHDMWQALLWYAA